MSIGLNSIAHGEAFRMLYFAVWRINFKKIFILIMGLTLLLLLYKVGTEWLHNRTINVLSWAAANKIVIVDPGHGGADPGAIGSNGTLEKNVTLPVGMRLSEYLSQSGAMVVMTRDEDEDLGSSKAFGKRKREDLKERARIVKDSNADLYINVQLNSFKGANYRPGGQVFYYKGDEEGKRLATHIQNELRRILKNTTRQPLPLDIYMLRNVKTTGVVVEVGFLSNPVEENMLNDKTYQSKLAYAMFSGIVRYLADDKAEKVINEFR